MSLQFNLEKSSQNLQFNLAKHSVREIKPCQVSFTCDVSGSFTDEIEDGRVQKLLNRFVPFADVFDKDKTMSSFAFSNIATQLNDITVSNYSNYVKKHIEDCSVYCGGTSYHTAFQLIVENTAQHKVVKSGGFFGFGGKTETVVNDDKHLHFFITDGHSSTESTDLRVINSLLGNNGKHFIVFLSISPRKLDFLERHYGDHQYADYHNFTNDNLKNIDNLTDEDLYDLLLSPQLVNWMNG